MRSFFRLLRIAQVLLRYRLDELVRAAHLFRPLRFVRGIVAPSPPGIDAMPRGERVKLALEELGPIFVKFGQILSTRRDLIPPDVADQLALLRDRVAPFDGDTARAIVEEALGEPVAKAYGSFERMPLASASIAQVHAATLPEGREVVVKVLRPGIAERIERDVKLLYAIGRLAQRHLPDAARIQPLEVVAEIDNTLKNELDLQREGANASLLRRNFEGSPDLYVPEIVWSHSTETVLTMERVRGIPSDDVAALDAAGIDRAKLAAKGVRLFYTQVFRDNFFHADAHAGNIWVDAGRKEDPRFIALDFGIMGALPPRDQYFLAENFAAMFARDYRRIAELHIEAQWMPSSIRVDELEAGVRAVCEPYFTRPLSEIMLGEVVVKIFKLAHRYQLTIQPQLLLLQKTLLNIEGVGRLLDPKLDIFAVAKPVLDDILRERYSVQTLTAELRKRLPEIIAQAPEFPRLVHDYFAQAVKGEQSLTMRSRDLERLAELTQRGQRRLVFAVIGAGALVCSALLAALEGPGRAWLDVPASAWTALAFAIGAFAVALKR